MKPCFMVSFTLYIWFQLYETIELKEWRYGRANKICLDRHYCWGCNWNDHVLSTDGIQNYQTLWFW